MKGLPAAGLAKLSAAGTMVLFSVSASCDSSGFVVGAKSIISSAKTSLLTTGDMLPKLMLFKIAEG